MLLEGYKNAGENFKAEQAEGQKNNAEGSAVKSSKQESQVIDLSDDNDLSARLENKYGSERYKTIRDYILTVLKNQPIKLSDGKDAIVDKRDAIHIANKSYTEKTVQIAKIKELVEKAELYAEDVKVEHEKFNYFCYYKADVKYRDETYPIYLNVGKAKNDGKYHIYDITKKLRDTANRINGFERPKPNEGYAPKNDVSIDIIPKTIKSVKQNFSVKQTDEITKFNMQTAKENRIYRQIFNLLDDTVYTGIKINKIPDPKFIRQQAQEMLKEVGSTYSVDEFAEELTVIYEYMSQQAGKNLYKTEDFFPNVLAIARRVVDQCTEKDSSAYDDAKEIRDLISEIFSCENMK